MNRMWFLWTLSSTLMIPSFQHWSRSDVICPCRPERCSQCTFCFTSTEGRWLVKDGDRGEGDERVKARPRIPPKKRPERPWTAARTMEVSRRCPLAIAQRLVHCAIAVSTAVLGQSHEDNVRCTAVQEQLEAKEAFQLSQPSSTSLLMISSGLT